MEICYDSCSVRVHRICLLVAICVVFGKSIDKRSKIMEEAILWNKMALIVETILMEQIKRN